MKKQVNLDLKKLKTCSILEREHIVKASMFVEPTYPPCDVLAGLPDVLAGKELKILSRAVADAYKSKSHVVLAMGAHVIKCGLSKLIIDLMERGIVTGLAFNGAGAVHDWELAFAGMTSEKVSETITNGFFGMVRETPQVLNSVVRGAATEGIGFGEALGKAIEGSDFPHKSLSLFAAAYRLGLPATVHVAIGCDTIHMFDSADGASIGAASMSDFRTLADVIAGLENGVWLNIGSSVVLPEVFLKALSMARNLTGEPKKFTTANLDMIRHYRPQQNVLSRPGGTAVSITGHHEILVPLLRWGILWALKA